MLNQHIEILKPILKDAGRILLHYRNTQLTITTKEDEYDLVTRADIKSDAFLRKHLTRHFPSDQILSEESDINVNDFSKRVWMVDPLDGTKQYLNGSDDFSIVIGLAIAGQPMFGVVFAPITGTWYYAAHGEGAWKEGPDGRTSQIQVSTRRMLTESRIVVRRNNDPRDEDHFINTLPVAEHIPCSSGGLKVCLIAEGSAEGCFALNSRSNKWDYCGPDAILREAGGRFTDIHGNDMDYAKPKHEFIKVGLQSNGHAHDELLKELHKSPLAEAFELAV